MTERLVTTSRERLVAALDTWIRDLRCQGSLVDYLVDNGHILVVDPADPELVQRVAAAMADIRCDARAVIEAVLS